MIGNSKTKINKFNDLIAWQEGHKLVLFIYEETKRFPKEESFGLTSQMRRSAVSITSNIAEGFGRQGYKEKIQFFYLANGSLIELVNQLLVAKDVGYTTTERWSKINNQAEFTHKLLQGLIKKSKEFLSLKS